MISAWRKFLYFGWIILAIGIASSIIIIVAQSPSYGERFLEALRIIISWPFVIGALVLLFGISLKREIKQFIGNIGFIRFPGGTELRSSQSPTEQNKEPPSDSIQPTILGKCIEDLTLQVNDAYQEKDQIINEAIKLLSDKHREVVYWWFQYLSVFFVPYTKLVLWWFASQSVAPTKEFYDEFWKMMIIDTNQRETILMVLLHHRLIKSHGHVLQITQAGLDFLSFLSKGS